MGAPPRLFKTHQRLSSINRGARYICLIRRIEDVLLSWWHFLRSKDVPPLRKYSSASEFAFDDGFFAGGMRFGATIWEYYVEFFKALQLNEVLVLCYEDLTEDLAGHIDLIAAFLGIDLNTGNEREVVEARVLQLCSKKGMAAMGHRFDESWAFAELQRVGRMKDVTSFAPAARVREDQHKDDNALSEAAQELLRSKWEEHVCSETGLSDYAALRKAARMEVQSRRKAW